MTSYLKSIFGVRSSSKSSEGRSKSHSRSHSVPTIQTTNTSGPAVPPNYIYTTVAPSSTSNHGHSPTCPPTRPSPLRYNTYDASTMKNLKHHDRSCSSGSSASVSARSPSGTVSYKSGDNYFPYPIYTPSSSHHSNSRSNSNSSIYPSSVSSHHSNQSHGSHSQHSHHSHHSQYPPAPPRTSSSGSVTSRPALKQTHTWHGGIKQDGPRPHVSFVNPKRPRTLNMHPLLASSAHNRAPISYDVMFSPNSSTIVDRSTRTTVPSHTLGQPCTDPPTLGKLVLRSDKFPWAVVVHAGIGIASSGTGTAVPVKSPAKFYLAGGGGGSTSNSNSNSLSAHTRVSNLDLIHAIHNTLSTRVTKEEWDALGSGSRAQSKVTKAYERRCRALRGGWDQGVKRIDWLGEKTRLIGVEVDKAASETGVAKLVFGKP
ncbi:hypothetical protein E1B28_003723 [Marasmius oreades]|uniref:DUF6699 domain-containing protein n=1 Tax=Marasmius oreades TaxID=181124 RepID=A0A9P7UX75_9AGAR|nr:uncharacterized protein E1B28_003723 [Marasmius oreades]KAG7096275.1 hypothetical protein E1B28_003723 [Marasmius oreades]